MIGELIAKQHHGPFRKHVRQFSLLEHHSHQLLKQVRQCATVGA